MPTDFGNYVARRPRHPVAENTQLCVQIERSADKLPAVLEAELLDLSGGGVRLRMAAPLLDKEAVSVRLQHQESALNLALPCTVQWHRTEEDGTWSVGCRSTRQVDWKTLCVMFLHEILTTDNSEPKLPRLLEAGQLCVRVERSADKLPAVLEAELLDLSGGGVRLRMAVPPLEHESILVQIEHEKSAISLALPCTVQWQRTQEDGAWLVGCRSVRQVGWKTLCTMFSDEILGIDMDFLQCASPRLLTAGQFCVRVERSADRLPVVLEAELLDLSADGLRLRMAAPLLARERITVQIEHKKSAINLALPCTVQWHRTEQDGTWSVGCRSARNVSWKTLGKMFVNEILTTNDPPSESE